MKDFIKQAYVKLDSPFGKASLTRSYLLISLTHDGVQRPAPKELLKHPWIQTVTQQDVQTMTRWIGQVWGWKTRKSRSDTSDSTRTGRPSSSGSRK